MNNKAFALPIQLLLLIGIVLAGVTIVKYGGNLTAFIGGQTVYQANWGTLECKKSPSYQEVSNYVASQQVYPCGVEYTDRCEFYVECIKSSFFDINCIGEYWECDINGNNCIDGGTFYRLSNGEKKQLPTINRGRSYKFDTGLDVTSEDKTKVTKKYQEWKIWQEEFGKDFISNSEGCKLPYGYRDQVEDMSCIEQGQLTFDDSCRVLNYITSWVPTAGNVYSFNGRDVVCQAKTLYEVDRVKFEDGNYRYLQVDEIMKVECCPYELNCGDDFKFPEEPVFEKECSYDYECIDWVAVDANSIKRQTCVNGECIWGSSKSVDCTTTAECIRKYGSGYVCKVENNYQCVKSQVPSFCGDGVCDELEGENLATCSQDCICPEGENYVERVFKKNCLVPIVNIGCDEVVEKKCVKETPWYLYAILIALIILVGLYILPLAVPLIRRVLPI